LELAREYLLSTRAGGDTTDHEARLAALGPEQLDEALAGDDARKAFWVDVYNGAVQRHGVSAESGSLDRLRYFRQPLVTVAGRRLSLDAIEHGLLRRSRWRLGLGYLGNPLPSPLERRQRVAELDARVHFALNCGVASCPPIAAYDAERIDRQLEQATASYLRSEVKAAGDGIAVPALLLWYIGDFGGPRGIRRLLRRHGVEGWGAPIRFGRYDWTPAPNRWRQDEG
jgi:hypothetical protein